MSDMRYNPFSNIRIPYPDEVSARELENLIYVFAEIDKAKEALAKAEERKP